MFIPKISNLLRLHIAFLVCLKQVLLRLRHKAQQKGLTHVINAKLKLLRVGCERILHFRCSPTEGARPSPSFGGIRSLFFFQTNLYLCELFSFLKGHLHSNNNNSTLLVASCRLRCDVVVMSTQYFWVLLMFIFLITGCTHAEL